MFINSNSQTISKIYRTLQASKELMVSSLIYGEEFTGKKTLAKRLFENFVWVRGENIDDVKRALELNSHIVITNFENIGNIDLLEFENANVVAIYNGKTYNKRLENKFAFIYYFPSLREREEDIELFTKYYTNEAKEIFDIQEDIKIEKKELDISKNLKSLRSSIFKTILFKTVKREELSYIMFNYFLKNYKGNNVHKEQLEIFEKALIEAGLQIYGSQLKLSEIMGINRNTLRKKINEYF